MKNDITNKKETRDHFLPLLFHYLIIFFPIPKFLSSLAGKFTTGEIYRSRKINLKRRKMSLITGVPDDITKLCLARVPRESHIAMKCVSRKWRDFVSSDEFCEYRNKFDLAESWIYALCRDKSHGYYFLYVLNPFSLRRVWKRVHEFPAWIRIREGVGVVVLGKRLFVLGGCGWLEDATDEVYCYDAGKNTWIDDVIVPPLLTKRCYFGCEVVDGKIMAIGGLNAPGTWDVYDPVMRTCESRSDVNVVSEIQDSFVMDGRVYVLGGDGSSVAVYDVSSGIWKRLDDDMALGWRGPAVVVGGDLYVLDQSFGATLTMWCKETRMWIRIGKLSQLVMKQPCRLVSVGNSIFVIGKDCSTVVIDVENVRKNMINGVMVCSSIPKTWDDDIDVITCKSIAL